MQEIELSDLEDKTTNLSQSVNELQSDISKTEEDLIDLNFKKVPAFFMHD